MQIWWQCFFFCEKYIWRFPFAFAVLNCFYKGYTFSGLLGIKCFQFKSCNSRARTTLKFKNMFCTSLKDLKHCWVLFFWINLKYIFIQIKYCLQNLFFVSPPMGYFWNFILLTPSGLRSNALWSAAKPFAWSELHIVLWFNTFILQLRTFSTARQFE